MKNQNEQLINEFIAHGSATFSKSTIASYRANLRKADRVLNRNFCTCTIADIESAVSTIVADGSLGVSATRCTYTALRALYAFLLNTRRIAENPVADRRGRRGGKSEKNGKIDLDDFGVTDTNQMISHRGRTYSMVALSALLLAVSPGFVDRVAKSTDAVRLSWQNETNR